MTRTALALLLSVAMSATAEDKKPEPGKAVPESAPVELTISGDARYTLDLGGKTAEEFAKLLEDGKTGNVRMPAAPAVKLTLTVKNTSDKAIKIWHKGDPVVLDLELKGPGAVSVAPLLAFTADFRLPEEVELAAGKTLEIPLKGLVSGFRGASKYTYWTNAGAYELIATWKTGISPVPKGAMDQDGFGVVTVASKPFKIEVEPKK